MSPEQLHTHPLTGEMKVGNNLGTCATTILLLICLLTHRYWEEKMVLSPFVQRVYGGTGEAIVHSS